MRNPFLYLGDSFLPLSLLDNGPAPQDGSHCCPNWKALLIRKFDRRLRPRLAGVRFSHVSDEDQRQNSRRTLSYADETLPLQGQELPDS